MSFYFNPDTLEISGIPFELVKSSIFRLPDGLQQLPAKFEEPKSDIASQMEFLLWLLRTVMEDKEYIKTNCNELIWYLPAQFLQVQANDRKAQYALWKSLVRIHDVARCFSIYLDSCRASLKRSENATSEKLNDIIDETGIKEEIKRFIQAGGMEFWQLYQEESKRKGEQFPSISDALVRVVANSDKLYPVLPAVYTPYILKKMGHPSKIAKEALLAYDSTMGTLDYRWSENLLLQAKYMGGIIQQRFYEKIRDYFSFFQYEYKKSYDPDLYNLIFSPLSRFDDWEDETPKEQERKEELFSQSNTILFPICNVRRLALDLGKRYGLSTEEIGELHQKLPGYLYSTAPSKYTPSFSTGQTETLESILKSFRKICDPSYYCLAGSSKATVKEKEFQKLTLALASPERKAWSRSDNNRKASQKDVKKFIKRYLKFWDPVLLTLFCCAPIPMELSSERGIIPYSGDIRESLQDTLEEEFKACLGSRGLSRTFSDSVTVRPLLNLSKRVLTLKDAIDLLQQLLDQKETPKVTLNKFFRGQPSSLVALWQHCDGSDENISYIYTHLLEYAQKLVSRAAMGVYYRAVFLKYGGILD